MADAVEWPDVMIDTETTGLNAHINGVIQIGAIKFNLKERKIGPMFDRCPMILPFRQWNEETRQFWQVKHRNVYMDIVAKQEPAEQVWRDFWEWLNNDGSARAWAKPTHFDWGFIASGFEHFALPMPVHYRTARDLNSFMAGLTGEPDHVSVENEVPFPEGGKLHYALHDSAWQIDQLFYAMDKHDAKGE